MEANYFTILWWFLPWNEVKWKSLSHFWLCDPMDYTGHGIFQARILEWVVFPFSRESYQPKSNPGLLHCRQILYQLSHSGRPRILEWVAYPFTSRSSWPRDWTRVSSIAGGSFTNWAMRAGMRGFAINQQRCTCVSWSWTPLQSLSPSHPSGLSQCTSFECPVSCINLGLIFCFTYGNIHVSMLFSQIIPLSPSPTESNSLSIFISFAILHIGSSLPSF